jgi:hypothetical protein
MERMGLFEMLGSFSVAKRKAGTRRRFSIKACLRRIQLKRTDLNRRNWAICALFVGGYLCFLGSRFFACLIGKAHVGLREAEHLSSRIWSGH